jgi:multidrug resistance efflux pump
LRLTGTLRAVRANGILVPEIRSQDGGRLTLLKLVPNGTRVQEGDLLASFDGTRQVEQAREAKAKFEDLTYQVKQKQAQNVSDSEKRLSDIQQAEADMAKARIQLQKGPPLNEIDRLKNEEKAAISAEKVASLRKIHEQRTKGETAALRILELQRDRQKVALERAENNLTLLELRARYRGMVALHAVWRNGSMGTPQEGDRIWGGEPLLQIFDPAAMEVSVMVGEPDAGFLKAGTRATVLLDAYPGAKFGAVFHSASPVAAAALGSPVKNFLARFLLEQTDPRLLPDLSAALLLEAGRR